MAVAVSLLLSGTTSGTEICVNSKFLPPPRPAIVLFKSNNASDFARPHIVSATPKVALFDRKLACRPQTLGRCLLIGCETAVALKHAVASRDRCEDDGKEVEMSSSRACMIAESK